MATRAITDHEFRYKVEGGSFTSWIGCTIGNTTDNEDGTYTINDLDYDIPVGDFQVRVKSLGGNPPSAALSNSAPFIFASGFSFKRQLTIDNTNTGIALSQHQFRIELNSENFTFENAEADGSDVRVFDGNTQLPIYIESYSQGDETAVIWAKLSAPSNSDKILQIRYGKPDAVPVSNYSDVFSKKTPDETTMAIYNLDEGTGSVITDEHGDFPAVVKGHTWVADLDFPDGHAISLSGTNSSIRVPGLLASFGTQGCIAMSFKANSYSNTGRLFTKFIADGKPINLFINDNTLVFQTINGSLSNQIFSDPFSLGVKYRVAVNWDNINFYFYMNGDLVGVCQRFHIDGDYTPLTFGAYVDSPGEDNEQACFDGIIDNIVVYKKMLTENEVKADFGFRKNIPTNQSDKIRLNEPEEWLLGELTGNEYSVWECSIIEEEDGELKVYYTGNDGEGNTRIYLATAPNIESSLTRNVTPLIGRGSGGAGAFVNANCSHAFKFGGFYYVLATNGYSNYDPDTAGVYMYKSTDGFVFTSLGRVLDFSIFENTTDFGNIWLVPQLIAGKFYFYWEGVVDGNFRMCLAEGTDIEGPFTFVSDLPSLNEDLALTAGACVIYKNNKFHMYYHGHIFPNVNSCLCCAVSDDGINWAPSTNFPMAGVIEARTIATDQNADPCLIELGGKVYLASEFVDNTYPAKSDLYLWKFNGDFDGFVRDGVLYEIGNEI